MVTFRQATPNDIPTLIKFDREAQSKRYTAYLTVGEWLKEMSESTVYIFEDDSVPIGMFSVQEKTPDHIYFAGFVVGLQYRGRGYARQAMCYFLSMYSNARRIDLVTHPQNSNAIMLYLKSGFFIEAWKENFYGDGEPRIVMARVKI